MTHGEAQPGQQFGQGEATLSRGSGLVAEARADLTSLSARLGGDVDRLRAGWHGRGATAFYALHQAWTEKQAVIVGALDDLAASLTTTERDNVATDDDQGAVFGRLAGRLG